MKQLLAKTLNMGFIEKRTGITPREIVGNHLHADVSAKGVGQTALLGLSGASAALGFAGAAPTMVGAVGLTGALYFVGTTLMASAKALSRKKYK